jgi:1,4-dihydroxy-2-naphthoate octaprenyltransferase
VALSTSSEIDSGSWRAWLLAARPATLLAGVVPVVVGTACAAMVGGFAAGPALAALLGAVFLQIGTNYANDVSDFAAGADTAERLGPTRATQAGLLTPRQMWWGVAAWFGLATLCGAYLAWMAGWPVIVIGVASILAGLAYTGGPYPLGYNGLGELFVLVFFGFVAVAGTAWVQAGFVPTFAWWAAVPVGCLASALLVVNNLRDIETDAGSGKRTLAVRFGRTGAKIEYLGLLAASYAVPVLLVASAGLSPWLLLPLATSVLAWQPLTAVLQRTDGPSLNRALAQTARLELWFGLLLALGLWFGRTVPWQPSA